MEKKIKLGQTAKDKITGYIGVVTMRAKFLYGCTRLTLQARERDKEGKPIPSHHLDEEQAELVPHIPNILDESPAPKGGDREIPDRTPDIY